MTRQAPELRHPSRATRSPGSRAGIDLERIVEAARSLGPDALTMQAVADTLGVDRKALNHHVGDRETLLALVAQDAFSAGFSAVEISARGTWQDACRAHAIGFVDAVIAIGALADRLRLADPAVTRFLEPTEAVLEKMVEAGFDDETAQRSIALLTNICMAHARDVVSAAREGVRPRPAILRGALSERDPADYEVLARIAAAPADTYGREQLEFSIGVFLRGAEALLPPRAS